MKKAFVFDMDGVIVDSEKYYHHQRMTFMKQEGLTPGVSDMDPYVGASFDKGWKLLVPDERLRVELLPKYLKSFDKDRIDYSQYVNPLVKEFLQDLKAKDYVVAIASAGSLRNIEQMLEQCNFKQYFDSVLTGEEVIQNKPAPDIYLESARKAGFKPEECVALEDSTLGIRSAKAAGLETWALKYPEYNIDQHEADHIFAGFGKVREYFKIHF